MRLTPAELRAVTGTKVTTVAAALRLSVPSLLILEATPVEAWTLAQLRGYCAACGCELDVVAVDRIDGDRLALR